MPLTLEQYADFLDTRDLPWPIPPAPRPVKAKPALAPLAGIRVVAWNLYGTLLSILGGKLFFEHPDHFVMELALNKTVQEFKMWGSMSRKPGQPAEYMAQIYGKVLFEQKAVSSPQEKYPEILSERIWEGILKKLLQKDYKFETSFFGSLNEYSRKIAYFYHASIQGTRAYEGAAATLEHVHTLGHKQIILGDAQCFSLLQLKRGLAAQRLGTPFEQLIDGPACVLSHETRGKKPSERLFRHALERLRGYSPGQILHVGSSIEHDIVPAKRAGMRTALFAGDKESLDASADQLKDPATRPDVLLTELSQLAKVLEQ